MLFCYSSGTVATSQSIPEAEAATDSDHDLDVPGTALTDCCECSSPKELSGSSVDEAKSLSNPIDCLVILAVYSAPLHAVPKMLPLFPVEYVRYCSTIHYFNSTWTCRNIIGIFRAGSFS